MVRVREGCIFLLSSDITSNPTNISYEDVCTHHPFFYLLLEEITPAAIVVVLHQWSLLTKHVSAASWHAHLGPQREVGPIGSSDSSIHRDIQLHSLIALVILPVESRKK